MNPATIVVIVLFAIFILYFVCGISLFDVIYFVFYSPYYAWRFIKSIFRTRRENFERGERFRAKMSRPGSIKEPASSAQLGNAERADAFRNKVRARRKPEVHSDVKEDG